MQLYSPERPKVGQCPALPDGSAAGGLYVMPLETGLVRVTAYLRALDVSGYAYRAHNIEMEPKDLGLLVTRYAEDTEATLSLYFNWRYDKTTARAKPVPITSQRPSSNYATAELL